MESYLYINIHTGDMWRIGRGGDVVLQRTIPLRFDPSQHRIEIASCWMREDGSLRISYYDDSRGIFETGWILTSEIHGDQFIASSASFGCGESNGRQTSNYSLKPLGDWRELEVGERLVAHPPGDFDLGMAKLRREWLGVEPTVWKRIQGGFPNNG